MQRAFVVFALLVGILTVACTGNAAEILQEEGSAFRVVSGDWAAWTSREIAATPVPVTVKEEQIRAMLEGCEGDEALPFAGAIARGVHKYGWAQLESELEHTVQAHFLKFRAFTDKADPSSLVMERYDVLRGLMFTATLSLADGKIQAVNHDPPELADRSVYHTLVSPEAIAHYQEHFQKQFFESILNIAAPGMEDVRKAYEEKKIALALYEVAEYFRHQAKATGRLQQPARDPEPTTHAAAERVCAHIFDFYDKEIALGAKIDWDRHHEEEPVEEWHWRLVGHGHFGTLLNGYLATGNEKYTDEFVEEMVDFVIQSPPPPYSITRGGAWRNLEAGHRAGDSWPHAFYGFLSSPRFTAQAIQLMLGCLWGHGNYIYEHPAGLRRPSNWSIIDSSGLAGVSMYFPEFTDAAMWRAASFERLTYQLNLQVYPDGALYELAPGYHVYSMGRFDKVSALAEETGFELDEEFAAGLESMYECLLWLTKPDRGIPELSDTVPVNLSGLLLRGADLFDRDDMRYVGTDGKEGQAPAETSHILPYSGYAMMRSDWSRDALYLCFDGGPVGTGHQHDDMLSFILYAYGRPFIVDRGPHRYNNDKWRAYAIGSRAHSTVLIDGQEQIRVREDCEIYAPENPEPVWISNDEYDYTKAAYTAGYGPERIPVTHERHVYFKKPEYWVIVDRIMGEGVHEIESLFHFAPDLDVVIEEELATRTQNVDGPNLLVQAEAQEGLQLALIKGQEEPIVQGWHTADGKEISPAFVASYGLKRTLPFTQAYLLYPDPQGRQSRPQITTSTTQEGTLEVAIQHEHKDTDRIRIDLDKGRAERGQGRH